MTSFRRRPDIRNYLIFKTVFIDFIGNLFGKGHSLDNRFRAGYDIARGEYASGRGISVFIGVNKTTVRFRNVGVGHHRALRPLADSHNNRISGNHPDTGKIFL